MDKDYEVEFYISEGGLTGSLRIVKDQGDVREISVDDLKEAISGQGITFGILQDALEQIAKDKILNKWVVFARGVKPEPGTDGAVKFHFEKERTRVALKETPDGKVNFKDLNLIQNVRKGDLLCEVVPPQPGRNGMTIRGEEIPTKAGEAAKLPGGINVYFSADRTQMFAAMDGLVRWSENTVIVEPVYTVHDVDASVGNIRFNGSVVVQGEVGDGYEIHAGKDITIASTVGRVVLEAGGDIRIAGGILGQEEALVTANGNVHAKFIQDAYVKAEGSIVVEDYIRNSLVSATGPVAVKNAKGFIVSSKVSSDTWIYCTTLGQKDAGIPSELSIGHSPLLQQEHERIKEEIATKALDFLRLYASLAKLRVIRTTCELTRQQEMLYEKIMGAMESIRKALVEKNARTFEITEKIHRAHQGNIYVAGTAHAGNTIRIGLASTTLTESADGVHFFLKEGRVEQMEYHLPAEVKKVLEAKE